MGAREDRRGRRVGTAYRNRWMATRRPSNRGAPPNRHALFAARYHGKPLSMECAVRRSRLGDMNRFPRRREPDLSAYTLPAPDARLRRTGELLGLQPYASWWYESPDAYDFGRELSPARRARPREEDIDAFAEIFFGLDRGTFADRFGWMLELSAMFQGTPAPEAAVRVYQARMDPSIAVRTIAFFRRASAVSIREIGENIAHGGEEPAGSSEEAFL